MIASLLAACAVEQVPLAPGDRPNLVLVEVRGDVPATPEGVLSVPLLAAMEDAAASRPALLGSQWSPREGVNHLPRVLSLYGYRTAATTAADAASFGFAESGAAAWIDAAPEPFLLVHHAGDDALAVLADVRDRVAARGLRDRTAVVFAWTDGWDQPRALWWAGPGAPPPLAEGRLASVVDVLPTLLAAAGATVPTDAGGVDLAAGASQVAFAEGADGRLRAWSSRHRLTARATEPLPADCPADAELTDAAGRPSDDAVARAALWDATRAWRDRLNATSGPGRLGREHFERLNAAQGYWQ